MFPQLAQFTDIGLLLQRFIVGLVFVSSGWKHLKDPIGGLGVAFGVFTQLAAMGLILLMLGAIQKKIFVWHTGFWGEKSFGWHYDLIFIIMNLVIAFTNGGRFVLDQYLPFLHL